MQFQQPAPHEALEQILWGFCVFCILFMLLVMPWVGPDGLITGGQWLGLSLTGMIIFGGAALAVRVVFSPLGSEYDEKLDNEFSKFNR